MNLTLVLAAREPVTIRRLADVTSDPRDPLYGRHLDREELSSLIRLSPEDYGRIAEWLTSHGMRIIQPPEPIQQLLFVQATRAQVETAFGAELIRWLERNPETAAGRMELALPRHLSGYVLKIGGLVGGQSQSGRSISGLASLEDLDLASATAEVGGETAARQPATNTLIGSTDVPRAGMTPPDIGRIYNFPARWDGSGETIALLLLGGRLDQANLREFWHTYGIPPPDVHVVQVGSTRGTPPHPLHTVEAEMSVEWAGAMAPGATIVVYMVDPLVMGDPWAAFLLALIEDKLHLPTVATISWVTPERQYYRLNNQTVIAGLLDQAAALGITVISASGDWGTYDGAPRTVRDGRYVSDSPWPHAVFPATEERVLSVGGTMITCLDPLTEVGWSGPPPPGLSKAVHFSLLASSGGFSTETPIPAWQRPVLRGYYPRGATMPAIVPFGRGFPDVAMMAAGATVQRAPGEPLSSQGYQALVDGRWIDYAGGTSLGAPIWAAIVARINQARRAAGRGRLGFANPALYGLADADPPVFRDITAGNTDVAMSVVNLQGQAVSYQLPGFEAREGWDPISGLGVPDVAKLIDALVSLPSPASPE
jgi:kumamolisin